MTDAPEPRFDPALRLRHSLQKAITSGLVAHPDLQVSCYLQFADQLQQHGDSGLWQQVLATLLAHSLQHGFSGRKHGTIQLAGTLLPGGRILLQYYDDGVGLGEAAHARLSEDGLGNAAGAGGSGLDRVRDLVHKRMGGRLQVHHTAAGVHISIEAAC